MDLQSRMHVLFAYAKSQEEVRGKDKRIHFPVSIIANLMCATLREPIPMRWRSYPVMTSLSCGSANYHVCLVLCAMSETVVIFLDLSTIQAIS